MKKIAIVLVITFISTLLSAQKFGYVNSQELLVGLPEIKSADTDLQTLQNQLVEKGKVMVTEFEAAYKAYVEEANKGLLSKVQMQKKEEELGEKNKSIQAYEQEVQAKVGEKREMLYKPILDKVTNAIKTYGKDNGYTMIFDTSAGMLLYAVDADNLMDAIKAKITTVTAATGK